MSTISAPDARHERLKRSVETGVPFGSTSNVSTVCVGERSIEDGETVRIGAAAAGSAASTREIAARIK
jgi:hypothetical protein